MRKITVGMLLYPGFQMLDIAGPGDAFAEVDILSGGRLRLGVGVGWNHVEYEALGTEWKTRGARQAEQIEVMRRLWTEDLVTFTGRFHTLVDVNLLPVPVQRPIPIWFGGSSDAVVKRATAATDRLTDNAQFKKVHGFKEFETSVRAFPCSMTCLTAGTTNIHTATSR